MVTPMMFGGCGDSKSCIEEMRKQAGSAFFRTSRPQLLQSQTRT